MEDVTAAFKRMREQQRLNIAKSFGVQINDEIRKGDEECKEFTEEQQEIIKGFQSDNPFEVEQARQSLDKLDYIQKSDIMEAIGYSDEFKVKKTGKEIKDQIDTVLLPAKQAALQLMQSKANAELSNCGDAPTADVCRWWCNGFELEVGYKRYDWEETRMKCIDDSVCDSLSYEHQEDRPKCNCPKTKDEAEARCRYNEYVQAVCEIMVDIKACEILKKNLKDDDSIRLTPRQVVTFKFD